MNIVPARIQEQISQVDPTRALLYGICGAATAALAVFKLFWLLFSAVAFSNIGFLSFVLPLVTWIAFAALGAFVALAYLPHYFKRQR
jgi:ABC-type antimicrobial peptide transport system permease subunit